MRFEPAGPGGENNRDRPKSFTTDEIPAEMKALATAKGKLI